MIPTFEDVLSAAKLLDGIAHKTPVLRSASLDAHLNAEVVLKCELFQKTGAFKFRGAYNALYNHQQSGGGPVLTFSSGNHGQALAKAGQLLGIAVTVVMPHDALATKKAAAAAYGAEIIEFDRSEIAREDLGRQLAEDRGLTVIPPYDNAMVVAGQGTAVKELLEEHPNLEAIVIPLGGGGLLAGSLLSAKALAPDCLVYGAEPASASDGKESLDSGEIVSISDPQTIADGARTPYLGKITFEIIKSHVEDILLVEEQEIIDATRFLWQRVKLTVEPTGALGIGAIQVNRNLFEGKRVGVILSGGNFDWSVMPLLATKK